MNTSANVIECGTLGFISHEYAPLKFRTSWSSSGDRVCFDRGIILFNSNLLFIYLFILSFIYSFFNFLISYVCINKYVLCVFFMHTFVFIRVHPY